jgi:predicted acyl esterase
MESEFPLARTRWTKFHLDARDQSIVPDTPSAEASVSYESLGEGVSFLTPPFEHETEITGFITARLWIASSTTDMDVFATLHAIDPNGKELVFIGAHEMTCLAKGWLRASHRKIDLARSLPYRVFHAHDEVQKLTPGELYEVDVEIWPTCFVFPRGWRLLLKIQGRDFEYATPGRMLHNHPQDRDPREFGGTCRIATGGGHDSYLLLPIIPPK